MSNWRSWSNTAIRRFIAIAPQLLLLVAALGPAAGAQGFSDAVAIRAAAIRGIHPIANAGPFLLVQDSVSGVAETQALARELGGTVRYVTSAPALRDGEMAIRAHILRANATEALVRVHFWGLIPGTHSPSSYWSEHLVTLRKQGTEWTVVTHVQTWEV